MNKQFIGGCQVIVAAMCWTMVCCSSASQQTKLTAVPLTNCCNSSEFYNAGFDRCQEWNTGIVNPELFPPIYSYGNNDNTIHSISSEEFDFSTADNLTSCPDGYVVKSWTEFKIFQDGKLKTLDGQHERLPGEFCIQRTESQTPVFAARLCVPDPCAGNETQCVRKCCPNGMVLNETDKVCQSSSVPFIVPFHDKSGTRVEPNSALITRDGVFPNCDNGVYALRPSEEEEDKFYILPNGIVHVPFFIQHDSSDITDYCIDHFTRNGTLVLQALVCFPPLEESSDNAFILSFYPYFLFASSFFLIVTLVVYALLPTLRSIHGVTLMCLIASMTVMYIGLAIIQLNFHLPDAVCVGLAIVVHFTFLSTFTWLNVMSFDLWWGLRDYGRGPRDDRLGLRFTCYSLYAWTIPTLIVGFGQVVDSIKGLSKHLIRPGFGLKTCWFYDRLSFITYLYGPMALLILANMFFFFTTAISLCRMGNTQRNNAALHFKKKRFRFIFILFVLMGMLWMMEVISFAVGGSAYIWIPTDILNILTGVFIFAIFVCNANVWSLLKNKYPSLKIFDDFCPTCMKYDQTQRDDDLTSNALQHTAI